MPPATPYRSRHSAYENPAYAGYEYRKQEKFVRNRWCGQYHDHGKGAHGCVPHSSERNSSCLSHWRKLSIWSEFTPRIVPSKLKKSSFVPRIAPVNAVSPIVAC